MPKLSIITINYNNKSGLEQTIQSVVKQSYRDFEFIIIDGESTDGSIDIIITHVSEITYWISEKDNGIYHAMNKGIAKANGEYLLFLNSGDYLPANSSIEQVISKNLTCDIVNFDAYVEKNGKRQLVRSKKTVSFFDFYKHTIIHQATLIKKDLFVKVGLYNESLKIVSDWEFFVKALFKENCSYQNCNLTLSVFDSDGISSKPENRVITLKERNDILELHFSRFLKDYNLIKEPPIYKYLKYISASKRLNTYFVFKTRVMNKILGRFIKIE